MTSPVAHPPLERSSMPAVPWAGSPWRRPVRRLLGRLPKVPRRRASDARPLMLRRVMLLVLVMLGAYVGTQAMAEILPERGASLAERGLLVLFGVLFAWISAGFWTGVMGAGVLLFGRGKSPLMRGLASLPVRPLDPDARTAIVMPICNEHVPTVFGGLSATIDSLISTGESENFDVYVLSDTSDPDIRAAEQAAWSDLAGRIAASSVGEGPALRVHYRWRQRRVKRKAGNVADFCHRWGAAYRYLVVLDADSVMTGECLTTLVRLMEAHPDAGIIQTAPRAVGHETLHGRVQQFSARAYGPLFTAGMRFWQLGESHYWGHNAILRMAPFMAHCALAPLSGAGPLSGEVMSHDFVEAALMRRAGWKVWVADEIDGSYEQVPPNLLAELQRDRRWCHGNLQNSRLMFEPRLHAVHRTAFLTGVLAYASSPLWLAFLLLSTLLFAQTVGSDPTYFTEPYQLFPIWPTANVALMLTLFGLTAVLLLAPKVLSLVALVARGEAERFGGAARLVASALIEFVHSLLLAPVRMLFHTQFVIAALTGWRLDWKSPPRDDAS
ncbi:MAG TPA: glucans biosynthesis glucosyltransferase MdoH, partial [Caldimonas sp.]|nr:glucans biosynthesis glucosyltransferase MdoH [Caldimonas sp.]